MRATHRLQYWMRFNGAHKFTETLKWYLCRFKKDGTLMVWRGTHLICMGSYPPTLFYFKNQEDWEKVRNGFIVNSFGDKKRYQFYYKLKEL